MLKMMANLILEHLIIFKEARFQFGGSVLSRTGMNQFVQIC